MQISARVIARSKSAVNGKEIVTFELIYPRMILAELNTHRILSKNSASSRAIPIAKVIQAVRENPAMPVHWGKNQPGMSAREELEGTAREAVQEFWMQAALNAAHVAECMDMLGAHKQVANRILEPFQWMKTVLTGTEFDNFYHLRKHPDADPNIQALAQAMWDALQASECVILKAGEWHVPYYNNGVWKPAVNFHYDGKPLVVVDEFGNSLADALAISSSCCAQTSFRTSDDSLDKAKNIYTRLVESKPVHASPFEHQATPCAYQTGKMWSMEVQAYHNESLPWPEGVTHIDRQGRFWSANFCGWIQHRQLIPDNACWDYKEVING